MQQKGPSAFEQSSSVGGWRGPGEAKSLGRALHAIGKFGSLLLLTVTALGCGEEAPLDGEATNPDSNNTSSQQGGLLEPGQSRTVSDECASFHEHFQACELSSLNRTYFSCEALTSPGTDPCIVECLAAASCEELYGLLCTGSANGDLDACGVACDEASSMVCEVTLPASWLCDSEPDCVDGSDEQDCPSPFQCDSGEELPADVECNDQSECEDGSDEHEACPPRFECENGNLVPASWECDGFFDCVDYSDEHDACPTFECDLRLPGQFRCDGVAECNDGSDEPESCPGSEVFVCESGAELPGFWECDGEEDCLDGSDEHADCPPQVTVLCANGDEIPAFFECDGRPDCGDGSDEHDECWYAVACGLQP